MGAAFSRRSDRIERAACLAPHGPSRGCRDVSETGDPDRRRRPIRCQPVYIAPGGLTSVVRLMRRARGKNVRMSFSRQPAGGRLRGGWRRAASFDAARLVRKRTGTQGIAPRYNRGIAQVAPFWVRPLFLPGDPVLSPHCPVSAGLSFAASSRPAVSRRRCRRFRDIDPTVLSVRPRAAGRRYSCP
ncbi:hypothetical protein RHECNPAF_430015 [Rhizobium etli CNPAF512]|nr:hypothetical protein RHECNPAF_430015 [Rhizobium etli CNPAF512]